VLFGLENVKLDSVHTILPENYHTALFKNLSSRILQKQALVLYYDGVLTSSTPAALAYHLKNIIRLKTAFPKNMVTKVYVGVPKNKASAIGGPSMAILPILKKNPLIDQIIYPAPWFPSVEFLEEKGIDFCAQNPSPVLSIRGYDLYKEVKTMGRLFPIDCKSKIQAF
jgi:hypothetical protein